jgi:hypothetical protein
MTMAKPEARDPVKPFLLETSEDGRVRLTVRNTHYNRWNYPIVTATIVDETFASASAARAHAKEHFGAEAGQFASK